MRTVNIGELKNRLSGYLKHVRNGEEIVVRDRDIPIARIVPYRPDSWTEHIARLVASGDLTMPDQEMDWKAFFAGRTSNISTEVAVQAVIDSRGDR